jgi:MarR family transcriptional regulator for hemolysin
MTKYDFESSVGFVVNNTAKAFQRALDAELRKNVGVTISQWRVISTLSRQPGLTQKEIADRVGIEGSTLVPIIDKMENDGFVKRKLDNQDRRINRIYLTNKADDLWNSMIECALRIRKLSTKEIPEEQIKAMLGVLKKIAKNLTIYFDDTDLTLSAVSKKIKI